MITQLEQAHHRLDRALGRIEELQSLIAAGDALSARVAAATREALAFQWETAAWAAVELAQIWVLENRLGMPRREPENFDLLVRQGWLGLEAGRKLKQACEFRNLASRDPEKIDWAYLERPRTAELETLRLWADSALNLGGGR